MNTRITGRVTLRKIKNRGFTPIFYRESTGFCRWGWKTQEKGSKLQVRFPGDKKPRWIRGRERRHVQEIGE